jgi:cytochrome c5
MRHISWIGLCLITISHPAWAGEEQLELKAGGGRELVMANCTMCHSLDMIQINTPIMKKEKWEATVAKMRKVMGAPIREEDVPIIVEYLSEQYGKD